MKATTRRKSVDLTVKNYDGEFTMVVLTDGRKVKIRQMIGKDFLFLEKNLKGMGDTERSFKLIERLSESPEAITYPEILELTSKDIESLSKGLAFANGVEDEELEELEDEELDY